MIRQGPFRKCIEPARRLSETHPLWLDLELDEIEYSRPKLTVEAIYLRLCHVHVWLFLDLRAGAIIFRPLATLSIAGATSFHVRYLEGCFQLSYLYQKS